MLPGALNASDDDVDGADGGNVDSLPPPAAAAEDSPETGPSSADEEAEDEASSDCTGSETSIQARISDVLSQTGWAHTRRAPSLDDVGDDEVDDARTHSHKRSAANSISNLLELSEELTYQYGATAFARGLVDVLGQPRGLSKGSGPSLASFARMRDFAPLIFKPLLTDAPGLASALRLLATMRIDGYSTTFEGVTDLRGWEALSVAIKGSSFEPSLVEAALQWVVTVKSKYSTEHRDVLRTSGFLEGVVLPCISGTISLPRQVPAACSIVERLDDSSDVRLIAAPALHAGLCHWLKCESTAASGCAVSAPAGSALSSGGVAVACAASTPLDGRAETALAIGDSALSCDGSTGSSAKTALAEKALAERAANCCADAAASMLLRSRASPAERTSKHVLALLPELAVLLRRLCGMAPLRLSTADAGAMKLDTDQQVEAPSAAPGGNTAPASCAAAMARTDEVPVCSSSSSSAATASAGETVSASNAIAASPAHSLDAEASARASRIARCFDGFCCRRRTYDEGQHVDEHAGKAAQLLLDCGVGPALATLFLRGSPDAQIAALDALCSIGRRRSALCSSGTPGLDATVLLDAAASCLLRRRGRRTKDDRSAGSLSDEQLCSFLVLLLQTSPACRAAVVKQVPIFLECTSASATSGGAYCDDSATTASGVARSADSTSGADTAVSPAQTEPLAGALLHTLYRWMARYVRPSAGDALLAGRLGDVGDVSSSESDSSGFDKHGTSKTIDRFLSDTDKDSRTGNAAQAVAPCAAQLLMALRHAHHEECVGAPVHHAPWWAAGKSLILSLSGWAKKPGTCWRLFKGDEERAKVVPCLWAALFDGLPAAREALAPEERRDLLRTLVSGIQLSVEDARCDALR